MATVDITAVKDGIATIELHGPKANAMSDTLLSDLLEAFREAERDDKIRGVLLTGRDRFFSAGLDLRVVAETGRVPERFDEAMEAVFVFPKPVAAAVNGHAVAGGCVLMLAADYTVLAEGEYNVGLTELDLGIPFPRIAFEIVRFALPPHNVPRILYGAQILLPEEAFAFGMGHELADPEELLDVTRSWLAMVTERPLAAFTLTKRWLRAEAVARVRASAAEERERAAAVMQSDETQRRIREAAARLKK